MEELSEALKAVEEQLNFARMAYRSIIYLYWAVAFPGIYVSSLVLSSYGVSFSSAYLSLSAVAVLLFVVENLKAVKKVTQLERVVGRAERPDLGYIVAQLLVWLVVMGIAAVITSDTYLSTLLGIGLGLLALGVIDCAFKRQPDLGLFLAGVLTLVLTVPYGRPPLSGAGYSTVVLTLSASLAAYYNLRRAMRE